ncbi:hypothetical protein FRAHR75_570017 [Frankia sp. Hr75.2]|nr:hypothetical protein FRAHR75_570017 [Frankia sp. Hr75.2]
MWPETFKQGGPWGEVSAGQILFPTASHRTGLARFRASGSPVISEDTKHRVGVLHFAYLPAV